MGSPNYDFELSLSVRDYECDLQGIVNNAVYQHYLEHARHEFLKSIGLDFASLHRAGKDPVVTRVEIDYKFPLTSGDRFKVVLKLQRMGKLRFLFDQVIFRAPDGKTVLKARVYAVFLQNGRPIPPPPEVLEAIQR